MGDERELEATGADAVVGFQVPMGIKKRKSAVDELLVRHPDINEAHVLTYFSALDENSGEAVGRWLDEGQVDIVADWVREHVIREAVAQKMREVVRKKEGGGGYALYSPNQGKKRPPKKVQDFPTKPAAKRAELARFPPKDPKKLAKARKAIQRMLKHPEKDKAKPKEPAKPKKEGADFFGGQLGEWRLRTVVKHLIKESLFREERSGSAWDEVIGRLSSKALTGDKKFQNLQRNIEKHTQSTLESALAAVNKGVKDKHTKVYGQGVKHSPDAGKIYLPFNVELDEVEVGPIAIYVDNGVPKIELSDEAKVALAKADPVLSKELRANLILTQERVLDRMDDLVSAVEARDRYLEKLEDGIDKFVAGLTPLQLSLMKRLLVQKYRKMT